MDTARPQSRRHSVIVLALALAALLFVTPAASAGPSARHTGVQRFLLISTDPDSSDDQPVLGFGPIRARGVDHVVSDTRDVFRFPAGSLRLTHRMRSSHQSADPATCLFTYTERGTYRITGGTRAYAHASGHGRYRVKVMAVGCKENAAPEVFSATIRARGPLTLP